MIWLITALKCFQYTREKTFTCCFCINLYGTAILNNFEGKEFVDDIWAVPFHDATVDATVYDTDATVYVSHGLLFSSESLMTYGQPWSE